MNSDDTGKHFLYAHLLWAGQQNSNKQALLKKSIFPGRQFSVKIPCFHYQNDPEKQKILKNRFKRLEGNENNRYSLIPNRQ